MRNGPDIIWIITIVFVVGTLLTGVAQSALL